MSEYDILKKSPMVFGVGLVVMIVIGFFLNMISIPLGFILGYLGSILSFLLIIKGATVILQLNRSVEIVVLLYILKLVVYASGFLLAIFLPKIFNLFAVLIGYFVIKVTITLSPIFEKRREG